MLSWKRAITKVEGCQGAPPGGKTSCLVMNPGLKFLTGVGSGEFFVARVWSAIYGLG